MADKCNYLISFEQAFRRDTLARLHILLGGSISCPVCSKTGGDLIIHRFEYPKEEQDDEKMVQT